MVPLSTPPIQCTAGLKICGHTETTQQCQGGGVGGPFLRVAQNTSF